MQLWELLQTADAEYAEKTPNPKERRDRHHITHNVFGSISDVMHNVSEPLSRMTSFLPMSLFLGVKGSQSNFTARSIHILPYSPHCLSSSASN